MAFYYTGPRYGAVILILTTALALTKTGFGAAVQQSAVSTCRPEFAALPDHTMCLEDSENVVESGVSDADKVVIVDYHNKVRRKARPVATDLTKLIWDDKLAIVAQKIAMQCIMEHDANKARVIPGWNLSVGQNLASGQKNWQKAMKAWFEESKKYKYGLDPDDYIGEGGWKKVGHYTQMVNSRVHRVGCGFALCENGGRTRRIYACNYVQS